MLKRMISLAVCMMLLLSCAAYVHAEEIDAPANLNVELKELPNGYPYFQFNMTLPDPVKKLFDEEVVSAGRAVLFFEMEMKVGEGAWEEIGGWLYEEGMEFTQAPEDAGVGGDMDIKANTYYFRGRFFYITHEVIDEYGNLGNTGEYYSPYTNTVTIGIGSYQYKEASSWAVPELDRAAGYGFITDRIKDKMNGPITREELCEVIMKLYEKMMGPMEYTGTSKFSDTANPEILKAFDLGIVNGVGNNKFAPKDLTNREQVAAMMYRAVNKVKPDADFSIEGAESFSDEKLISGWALTPVKFMNKNGLLKGSGGKVDPKGTTTREQAVLIIVRTYEKYMG